ncbi:MAG: hypothetical protein IJA55_05855 [Clostridia bacterium]|nr:hypothetical protein [Clostridia bacterium]
MKYIIIAVILTVSLLYCPVYADDDVSVYITEEMDELVPKGVYDDDNINYNAVLDEIIDSLGKFTPTLLRDMMSLLSVIILSAIFSVMCASVENNGIKHCLSYLSSGCIALLVYRILALIWQEMSALLSKIHTFMTTLTPVTTLLYSMGGNLTTATVNNTAMSIILSAFETICYYGIRPMLHICFGFSIVSVFSGGVDLKPIARFVRKSYTTVLMFVMSSMICILSLQNMLIRPRDSIGIRTVKFAAAKSIPIVGGALGEAAATVGTGIAAIRGTFGVLAIIALAIMILPVIISMWFNKFGLSFAAAICSILGLSKEESLISGAAELINFALAIIISSAAMFIISISMFASAQPVAV